MRVIEKTSERLHLQHRPLVLWGVMALLIGGALWKLAFATLDAVDVAIYVPVTVGMIGLVWWFMPAIDLVLDRAGGLAVLEERRATGRLVRRYPLAEVRRASLRYEVHGTSPRLNRLFLEVGDGEVALERGFGAYDRTALATEINRWLDPDDPAPVEPSPRRQSPPLMS